jgi:spore germination protein YaaH
VSNRRQALQGLIALSLAWRLPQAAGASSTVPAALGYLPWWMAAGWKTLPLAKLARVALFDATISPEGDVTARDWDTRAPQTQMPLDLTLTLFEQAQFDALFTDAGRRARLLAAVAALVAKRFVAGIQLDIEGYAEARPAALAGFRRWLAELDDARRKHGKQMSAFYPASDAFRPYDRAAAQRIDYWVAQIYDAHWPESKVTGPLMTRNPQNPVAVPRALARLGALGVAPRSILLSVPLYGWEWPAESEHPGAATRGRARLLTFTDTPAELMPNDRLAASALAREHGLQRDGEDTPHYAYRDGAHWRQGWYEDVRSLTRKLERERDQGYGGLAFFPLGYDRGEIVEPMLRWWARSAPPAR